MYQINANRPSSGDQFFNTTTNDRYTQFIQGKPDASRINVLCNCVDEVCGYFNKICSEVTGYKGMKYPYLNCNAEYFIERVEKYYPDNKEVQEPTEGGIMVWENYGDLARHVVGVVKWYT